MIPLRDHEPSGIFPTVTIFILALTVAVFLLELASPDLDAFISQWSLIPAHVSWGNPLTWYPFLTAAFLHAGFLHILGNMWFFRIFGDNVEAALGRIKFILFYLAGGVIAFITQYALMPNAVVPILGASGAVAAVLGFYIVRFPHNKVTTLIPLGFFITTANLPSVFVLALWFVIQLLSGTADIVSGTAVGAGVAWWAHVGGFVFGMIVAATTARRRYA